MSHAILLFDACIPRLLRTSVSINSTFDRPSDGSVAGKMTLRYAMIAFHSHYLEESLD